MSVSNQGVQRVGVHVDDSELDLVADLHTETDLGAGKVCSNRLVAWSPANQALFYLLGD